MLIYTFLDAAKRRTLPAWIREGLEKMENEKQKKAERDRLEEERLEKKKARELAEKEAEEEMLRQRERDGRTSPIMPRKSRFVNEYLYS